MQRRGILFLVVGPSGVGKDSLIAGARELLQGDSSFWFPRRTITRPAEAGGEDHDPCTLARFEAAEQAGAFLLSWRAHGQAYGIPAAIADALAGGRAVVVNVSRGVVDRARAQWPPVRVLLITAPRAVLQRRLERRGRESAAQIERRLEQAARYRIAGEDVIEIANDATLDRAIARFVASLEFELRAATARQMAGVRGA